MHPEKSQKPIVTFHRIFPDAVPLMRGDNAAIGTLPAGAFQYCEPVRTASSYGWYVFPPKDIRLTWNGVDTYYEEDGAWVSLTSIALSDAFVAYWNANAPSELDGCWPPFMTATFVPGIIQIWSGFLVSTMPDWSVLIGGPPNIPQTKEFSCFEGIVETDGFKPCPLFINIRLQTTDRTIFIPRDKPLFHVRPVHRYCYTDATKLFGEHIGLEPREGEAGGMAPDDWSGYAKTVRKIEVPKGEYSPGRYAARTRRKAKRTE